MHGGGMTRALSPRIARIIVVVSVVAMLATNVGSAAARPRRDHGGRGGRGGRRPPTGPTFEVRSLDGSGNNRARPSLGPGRNGLRPGRARELRRRRRGDGRRPERAVRQQPDLQRPRPEPLLREQHLAVGMGVGPVPRPRHGTPRRDAGRRRVRAVQRERPAGVVHERHRLASRSTAHRPRPAPASRRRASR